MHALNRYWPCPARDVTNSDNQVTLAVRWVSPVVWGHQSVYGGSPYAHRALSLQDHSRPRGAKQLVDGLRFQVRVKF
jgi:hypothetical protein